jgi:hypothetical protein
MPDSDETARLLGEFEPGGHADEFLRACTRAAYELAFILQGEMGMGEVIPSQIDRLEGRMADLQKSLDDNIRTMGSVLAALAQLNTDP